MVKGQQKSAVVYVNYENYENYEKSVRGRFFYNLLAFR